MRRPTTGAAPRAASGTASGIAGMVRQGGIAADQNRHRRGDIGGVFADRDQRGTPADVISRLMIVFGPIMFGPIVFGLIVGFQPPSRCRWSSAAMHGLGSAAYRRSDYSHVPSVTTRPFACLCKAGISRRAIALRLLRERAVDQKPSLKVCRNGEGYYCWDCCMNGPPVRYCPGPEPSWPG